MPKDIADNITWFWFSFSGATHSLSSPLCIFFLLFLSNPTAPQPQNIFYYLDGETPIQTKQASQTQPVLKIVIIFVNNF